MKKLATLFVSAMIVSTPVVAADATEGAKAVAIIDTMFDSSLINSDNITEVCITRVRAACNDKSQLEVGVGAAGTTIKPRSSSYKKLMDHGTIMADIVTQINPNANLVLIRTGRISSAGIVSNGSDKDFELALQWVEDNAATYNIGAVSYSLGSIAYARKSSVCPTNGPIQQNIVDLIDLGIPTIIAAGNDRNKMVVAHPACIDEAVAVSNIYSASYKPYDFSTYRETRTTNSGAATDFWAYGTFYTVLGKVAESTSASAAALAGYWLKVSDGSFQGTYDAILTSSSNKFVDVLN